MSIGVPIKVLHEAEGHVVTLESTMGELFRGKLVEAEDNMNCLMANITVTYRDGRTAQLEQVYIRGSKIRFLILPDMLKNAPMFKNIKGSKASQGRGKTAIIRASVNKGKPGVPGAAAGAGGRGAPPGGAAAGAGRSRGTNVYQKK
jgi:small nuclear ribonucleoprotein D3